MRISNKSERSVNPVKKLIYLAVTLALIILPAVIFFHFFSFIQERNYEHLRTQKLEEISEKTAHLLRLSDQQSYYQNALTRLANSFRWVNDINEISMNPCLHIADIYLFDSNYNRLNWKHGKQGKIRISQNYLQSVIKIHNMPAANLDRVETIQASSFSGNSSTVYAMAKSFNHLIDFRGLGLFIMGGIYNITFINGEKGFMLAFINSEKIDRYKLAQKAIETLQKLVQDNYWFAWLDLNNPLIHSTGHDLYFSSEGLEMLSAESLRSEFEYKNHLYSIADTDEGTRLVTISTAPRKTSSETIQIRFMLIVLPSLLLFFIWKYLFNIQLGTSIIYQFTMLFGYVLIIGLVMLMGGIRIYSQEKERALIIQAQQNAVEILEKVDRNFYSSHSDLLRQYRFFARQLSTDKSPKEVFKPLQKAKNENKIAFASYADQNGQIIIQVPKSFTDKGSIESKFANLIGAMSSQMIQIYNSSRIDNETDSVDVTGIAEFSARPVEGLMANRSNFQHVNFDGDNTLAFIDLVISPQGYAKGCLVIVHNPLLMEKSYLAQSASNLKRFNYQLAAFPKKHTEFQAYFPNQELFAESPIWKLQDLVRQTQVACFKQGRVNNKMSLVTSIPGHNLKNYNLFLIAPISPVMMHAEHLSKLFSSSAALLVIFIMFSSLIIVRSLVKPISRLAKSADKVLDSGQSHIQTNDFENNDELETIATGLTDLIIKMKEISEGKSVKNYLLPPKPLELSWLQIGGLQINSKKQETEIYHFIQLDNKIAFIFVMSSKLNGIEASLQLAMVRMAARIISEHLNVQSAYHILRDIEHYFRINFRKNLDGNFFAAIVNGNEKSISFCGCGEINLCTINKDNEVKIYSLCDAKIGSSKFNDYGNQTTKLCKNADYYVLSTTLLKHCKPDLIELKNVSCTLDERLKQTEIKIKEKYSDLVLSPASMIYFSMYESEHPDEKTCSS